MLTRLYALRREVEAFLLEEDDVALMKDFGNSLFELQLAYLVDIFTHLNSLNLKLQGSDSGDMKGTANVFQFEDKLRAFMCKIDLWLSNVEENKFHAFPNFAELRSEADCGELLDIIEEIKTHLRNLRSEFIRYFPDSKEGEAIICRKIVQNPFIVEVRNAPHRLQEQLIDLQNDSGLKEMFYSGINLEEFWCKFGVTYSLLRDIAIRHLVQFSTTYLCEQSFATLLFMKNKYRNRLIVAGDLRVALTKSIKPDIPQLVKNKQCQKSH